MKKNLSPSHLLHPQGFQSKHKNRGDAVDLSEGRVWVGPKGVNAWGTSTEMVQVQNEASERGGFPVGKEPDYIIPRSSNSPQFLKNVYVHLQVVENKG